MYNLETKDQNNGDEKFAGHYYQLGNMTKVSYSAPGSGLYWEIATQTGRVAIYCQGQPIGFFDNGESVNCYPQQFVTVWCDMNPDSLGVLCTGSVSPAQSVDAL